VGSNDKSKEVVLQFMAGVQNLTQPNLICTVFALLPNKNQDPETCCFERTRFYV